MATNALDSELARFCDPPRFARAARRHRRAFAWEPQGWIPLGIHVVNPEHARGFSYGDRLNPEPPALVEPIRHAHDFSLESRDGVFRNVT